MLPSFKSRPLKEARQSGIAATRAQALSSKAEKLLREAKQLREIDGDEAGANTLETEAYSLQVEAEQQAKQADTLHKKAERKANVQALIRTPLNAAGTYGRQYFETAMALTNPLNRLQNVFAAATPFTGSFSREKGRLMGGSGGSGNLGEFGVSLNLLAKRIDESNTTLMTIARFQPKLLTVQNETKGAVDRDEAATRDVENKTVVVIKTLGEIKDALGGRGSGGMNNDPLWSPTPKSPPGFSGGAVSYPQSTPLISGAFGSGMTPMRGGPAMGTMTNKLLQEQTALLRSILEVDKRQLDELKEGDDTERLRQARDRDEQHGGMGLVAGPSNAGGQGGEQQRGGGLIGRIGGILATVVGGFFTARVAPLFGRLASMVGLRGLGGRLAAMGAAQAAGVAGAAEGVGARVVTGAATRASGGFLARTFGRATPTLLGRAGAGILGRVGLRGAAGAVARFAPGIGNAIGFGVGAMGAWEQARRGNWGGAALNAVGAGVSLIPGVGPWAGLALTTAANFVDTSRPRRGDVRAAQLRRAQETTTDVSLASRPSPTIITNNYNSSGGGDRGTVIAQTGKTILERSRGELFSYIG